MSIANYKPDATPSVKPNLPTVEPKDYKSIIYSDDNQPLHSLIAYIAGAPWSVDYYSQVVGRDNDLREIDPGQPNIYQQYQRILNLEIRVDSALSTGYDSTNGVTTSTGNGIIYPFFIPNVSDYFVTDAGDTRKGIFRITRVERKTFNRDSAFAVDYEMVGYVEVLEALYSDLQSKVIREYHFSKERLVEGLFPLLKESDHQQVSNLKALYDEIVKYYFSTFFNRRYMTLVLPGQEYAIYDSFLINYLFNIVDSFDAPELMLIKTIPTDNDPPLRQPQFWSQMLNRNYKKLADCNQTMQVANKLLFNKSPFLHGLCYTNIQYIVYPETPDISTLIHDNPAAIPVSFDKIIEATNRHNTLADLITDTYIGINASYPYIYTILKDNYYVLSEAFYHDTSEQSLLELLTKDYLKQQTIDLTKLSALCEQYPRWGRLEQFYYLPILMTLIKEADRSTYS